MSAPVLIRQRGAKSQAIMFGSFAGVLWALTIYLVATGGSARWWFIALSIPALVVTYATVRLLTLRVRLDHHGIWEPNPFRLTFHTPWEDVLRIRQGSQQGKMGVRFIQVEVVHQDKEYHEVVALTLQAAAADAPQRMTRWVEQFREAQQRWG